jgi:hypothetical protein
VSRAIPDRQKRSRWGRLATSHEADVPAQVLYCSTRSSRALSEEGDVVNRWGSIRPLSAGEISLPPQARTDAPGGGRPRQGRSAEPGVAAWRNDTGEARLTADPEKRDLAEHVVDDQLATKPATNLTYRRLGANMTPSESAPPSALHEQAMPTELAPEPSSPKEYADNQQHPQHQAEDSHIPVRRVTLPICVTTPDVHRPHLSYGPACPRANLPLSGFCRKGLGTC